LNLATDDFASEYFSEMEKAKQQQQQEGDNEATPIKDKKKSAKEILKGRFLHYFSSSIPFDI